MLKSEKCIYLVYCCEMMCKFQNTGVVVLARAIFLLLALLIHLLFLAKWCYFCLLKSWRRWCCLINIFVILYVCSDIHYWLGSRKGVWPVKNWVVGCWHGYMPGARCRFAFVPADATGTHCLLLQ